MTAAAPLRVAVLGARGIGFTHVRLFSAHGAQVTSILGSTRATSESASENIRQGLGVVCAPFNDLEQILSQDLDAVSICTPAALHFVHVRAALDHRLPVFCEKPLFWQDGLSRALLEEQLNELACHPCRRLFVNTSNAVFVAAVGDLLPPPEEVRCFRFCFHTRGKFKGRDIAIDLMPHGFSLLIEYLGIRPVTRFQSQVDIREYACSFDYGSCRAEFCFRENPEGDRHLSFACDDREFTRVQEGAGLTYRVSLRDQTTGNLISVRDPFTVYIDKFIKYCYGISESVPDAFVQASANLRMMADCTL